MVEYHQIIPALIILMAYIFVLIQFATGAFCLLRFLANPDKSSLRAFLLTAASLLASFGICHAGVFPNSFHLGICTTAFRIDLPLYLLSMFVGLLFSWELIISRRHLFRMAGAFGLFFLVINLIPGIADYAYQAQFKPAMQVKPGIVSKLKPDLPVTERITRKLPAQKAFNRS